MRNFLTPAGLLLGLCLLVSGCKSETNHFCVVDGPVDEQGCFFCRDGSCSEQSAPERAECDAAGECGANAVCTDIGCVLTCQEELQCPVGTTCTPSGLCLNPEEAEPTQLEPPKPLEQVGFCPETPCADGRVCRTGVCRTPCESDEQCERADAAIRFCRNVGGENLCVHASEILDRCEIDVDCGEGRVCADGACQ